MKTRLITVFCICLAASFLAGCVAVVAAGGAAGGVAWVRGELQAVVDTNVGQLNKAVAQAGEDLKLNAISQEKDLLSGKFLFRNAQDEKITVQTEAVTESTAKVRIRIGMFGDQVQSQLILDKIKARL